MENKTFPELKKLIFDSELSFSEKEDLAWLFAEASEDELQAAFDLFTEDKEWIKKISDNYHSKKIALLADDAEMWKKILEDEETMLKKKK
ncbi:MAG: hypothetical protein WCT49_03695 [Candidatus Paceibacterota bacterium]|jgi:hypothetical protein|nr:hypothetical protein [Candidatus Paceibacterota bacterium]